MKTSIIIPSRGRAQQLIERVSILLDTVKDHDAEVVIVIDDDPESCDAVDHEMRTNPRWAPNACTDHWLDARVRLTWKTERGGPVAAWNCGLSASNGDAIVLAADDVLFHAGWLDAALAALATLPGGDGLVNLNDGSGLGDTRRIAPFFLASRRFIIEELGGCLAVPHYRHYYLDNEAWERAVACGRYVYCDGAVLEHIHPAFGKAETDTTYQTGDDYQHDQALFIRRRVLGYPDDFEPVITLPGVERRARPMPDLRRKTSVIMPSKGRPEQLAACVARLFETARGHDVECVIVCDETPAFDAVKFSLMDTFGEEQAETIRRDHIVWSWATLPAIPAFNEGLRLSTGEVVMAGNDDLWWGDGWLDEALITLATLPDGDGLVGLNDLSPLKRNYSTFFIATRRWLARENGGVLFCPHYRHAFVDPECCVRAMRGQRYAVAERSIVEHRHYLWGKAENDATYAEGGAGFKEDQALYEARLAAGFPDDFEPVIPVPKVYWAVPRERMIYDRAALALERVAAYNELRGYIQIQAPYAATDASREMFTRMFEKLGNNPDDWMVMLDDDHDHPEDVVESLANVGNVGVVSALCRRRGNEMDAMIYRRNKVTGRLDQIVQWPEGAIIPVDMGGAGAIAIRRWVIDLLHKKYSQKYWLWRYVYDDNCPERPGEEIYFWRMCEEAGVPMACNTGVNCPHLILTTVEKILAVAEAAAKGEDWRKVL